MVNDERARRSAELFGFLAVLVHRTSQDAAAILRQEGLNPAQFQLLLAVSKRPGALQWELGQRFGVTGGNVSQLLSRLTAAGWLRREAAGAANRIWLTAAGLELVDRLQPDQQEFMAGRFLTLSDHELEELHRLAEKVGAGDWPAVCGPRRAPWPTARTLRRRRGCHSCRWAHRLRTCAAVRPGGQAPADVRRLGSSRAVAQRGPTVAGGCRCRHCHLAAGAARGGSRRGPAPGGRRTA